MKVLSIHLRIVLLYLAISGAPMGLCQSLGQSKRTIFMNGCEGVEGLSVENSGTKSIGGQDWDKLMMEGIEAAHSKNYLQCRRKFQSALVLAESSHSYDLIRQSLDNLGWAFVQLKDYENAEKTFESLLKHLRTDALGSHLVESIHEKLAQVLRAEGKHPESVAAFRFALGEYGKSSELREFAAVLRKIGKIDEAQRVQDEADWMDKAVPAGSRRRGQYVPKEAYLSSPDAYRRAISKQIQNLSHSFEEVIVSFNIKRNGQIENLKVVQPSGDERIDKQTMLNVVSGGPYPPPPEGFNYEEEIVVPIGKRRRLMGAESGQPKFGK